MAMSVVYTTVNGQILRENRGGVVSDFVPDPIGSVVMVQDSVGDAVYRAEYDPYGNVQSETGTNPSSLGYVGTLGYIKDSATSMYVRARYLLNNLGRWLTKDPLWPSEPGYVYANAAPSTNVDPSGKIAWPMPPPGVTAAMWKLIIAGLIALGLSILEIFAILAIIALIILAIGMLCEKWKKQRYKACNTKANNGESSFSPCSPTDSCQTALLKRDLWGACVAIQAFLTIVCFAGNPSHGQALKDYIRNWEACEAQVFRMCWPKIFCPYLPW